MTKTDFQSIIDKYYPPPSRRRDIYMLHARQVADFALAINKRHSLGMDVMMVEGAAMLHDLGIFATSAPDIDCHGTEPYMRHGIIGADLIRQEGAPEEWARVAACHTGTGVTIEDIISHNLPLPLADYCPMTTLEEVVCYADKFYSKSGSQQLKTLEKVRASIARHGGDSLERFNALHERYHL